IRSLNAFQRISWPEIGIEFSKRAIEVAPANASLYEIAHNIHNALDDHGSPDYRYQVVVVPSHDSLLTWSVASERMDDYERINDFNGFDIHIFRHLFSDESGYRLVNAFNRIGNKHTYFKKEIRYLSFPSPSAILPVLHSNNSLIASIYGEDLFRSVMFIKKEVDGSYKPDLSMGHATHGVSILDTYITSYSVADHGRETTSAWKAYFFL
ncbi:hypothetical protein PMAYCL1PPCAC_13422, partial [Pristionchus mayeri]